MLKHERHDFILKQIYLHNKVLSADLSSLLGVSEDTIRRDLNELAQADKLVKVHGGALAKAYLTDSRPEVDTYSLTEKKMIAHKAIKLLRNGQFVLLGGGTTIREVIRLIPSDLSLTFITVSLSTALELLQRPHSEVIFIGGKLDQNTHFSTGGETISKLAEIQADICLLGTNAISIEAGITDSDYEVVQVKKAMIRAARKVAIVSIAEKLGSTQKIRVGSLAEIDVLITELSTTDSQLQPYTKHVEVW